MGKFVDSRKWPCQILLVTCLFIDVCSAHGQGKTSPEQPRETATDTDSAENWTRSVAVTNPQQLEVPEERVQVLHRIVQRVVADYLGIRESKPVPLRFELGQEREHFTLGASDGADTVYLKKWDESKFIASDVCLTVQHMVVAHGLSQMTQEISRRTDQIATVNKSELNRSETHPTIPPRALVLNSCVAGITDASQNATRCDQGAFGETH